MRCPYLAHDSEITHLALLFLSPFRVASAFDNACNCSDSSFGELCVNGGVCVSYSVDEFTCACPDVLEHLAHTSAFACNEEENVMLELK